MALTKYLVFLVVLVLISTKHLCNGYSFEQNNQVCAKFLASADESGNHLQITHGGQIPDILDSNLNFRLPPPDTNPETIILEIQTNCKLFICNEANSRGTCLGSSKNVTMKQLSATKLKIASAHCTCEKTCNCEDIVMRSTECARAYTDKPCSVCNAVYTDLRLKEKSLKKKVNSIVLRPGCTLTTFTLPDFAGNKNVLKSPVTKDLKQIIGSFKCTCSASAVTPAPTGAGTTNPIAPETSRPAQFPEMINFPNTTEELNRILNQRKDRHSGLIAALQSMKNKRSARNAYILILGLTGSGKSSTINFLFDNPNLAIAGDALSTTTDIHEYQVPIPVNELGMANSQLRVIDTPGLVDTRGLEQDAKFMTTLDKYLSEHEDLSKCVPNVVLILAKFNDNRFAGDGAGFVKMLRAIDVFRERIMSKKYSNVIIVLTHFTSETRQITRDPTARIARIRKTIEEFSQFPKPIVIALGENKPREATPPLPMVNGFYGLPNGDYYPSNIFKLIQSATTGSDPIGEAIIRTAFKNPDSFVVTRKEYPLVSNSHPKLLQFLATISETNNANPQSTEISTLLEQSWNTLDTELKKSYPDTLGYLQRAFFNRRILTRQSLPTTTADVAKFFGSEIRTNAAILKLLESALFLTPPFLPGDYVVGRIYKLTEDRSELLSPFALENLLPTTDIGFKIPAAFTCQLHNSVETIFKNYNSKEEYANQRLKELGAEGALKIDLFTGEPKPGRNVVNITDVQSSLRLSALIEYRTFQLSLTKNSTLSSRFLESLQKVSSLNFDPNNIENVRTWREFFNNFGTHVVKSAFGGGSLELLFSHIGNSASSDLFRIRQNLQRVVPIVIQYIEDSMIGRTINPSDIVSNLSNIRLELKFRGGDSKYYLAELTNPNAPEILENWRESINVQPVILENDITILPINQVVKLYAKNINADFHNSLKLAAEAVGNSTLVDPLPQRKPPVLPPNGREYTSAPTGSGLTEFLAMFKAMTEASRASQEKFQLEWLKMQREQQEREDRLLAAAETRRQQERADRLELDRRNQAEIAKARNDAAAKEVTLATIRLAEMKLIESQKAEQRRIDRQNELVAQQEANKQQQTYMKYIAQQNAETTRLQTAALQNKQPSAMKYVAQLVPQTIESFGKIFAKPQTG